MPIKHKKKFIPRTEKEFLKWAAAQPVDDEELTPEEIAGIQEGMAQAQRGEVIPYEEVKRELDARFDAESTKSIGAPTFRKLPTAQK